MNGGIELKITKEKTKEQTRRRFKKAPGTAGIGVCAATLAYGVSYVIATSTGVTEIDSALKVFIKMFLGIVTSVGVIILIRGIMEMANAYQQRDSGQMSEGLKSVVAGLIMALVSAILNLIGIQY
jgi:trwL6 protein